MTSNNLKVHDAILPEYVALARQFPVDRINFIRQLMVAGKTRYNPALERYKNLNFVMSTNDRLVNSENTLNLSQRLNLIPAVHPWAGHDLTLDDPDFMVKHCLDVLRNPKA